MARSHNRRQEHSQQETQWCPDSHHPQRHGSPLVWASGRAVGPLTRHRRESGSPSGAGGVGTDPGHSPWGRSSLGPSGREVQSQGPGRPGCVVRLGQGWPSYCKYLAQELGGEFSLVDRGHPLDRLFSPLYPPPGREPPCSFRQSPVGRAVTLGPGPGPPHSPRGLPAVPVHTDPTGSLSQTPLWTRSQPRGSLPGKYLLTRSKGRAEDRCSASRLEEPPALDAMGESCEGHLPHGEGALGQDRSPSSPPGPHPLCNCENTESEAGPDPALSPPAIATRHQVRGCGPGPVQGVQAPSL